MTHLKYFALPCAEGPVQKSWYTAYCKKAYAVPNPGTDDNDLDCNHQICGNSYQAGRSGNFSPLNPQRTGEYHKLVLEYRIGSWLVEMIWWLKDKTLRSVRLSNCKIASKVQGLPMCKIILDS